MIHKYDEIICSIHQGGHPASHHDPPVGGPWWGSFAKTALIEEIFDRYMISATKSRTSILKDAQGSKQSPRSPRYYKQSALRNVCTIAQGCNHLLALIKSAL